MNTTAARSKAKWKPLKDLPLVSLLLQCGGGREMREGKERERERRGERKGERAQRGGT
jgi:hypothetical protein